MPRHGRNIWVVRREGHYSIKEQGSSLYLVPPIPQRLAIFIARWLARANGSELVIQDKRGKIRAKDSHGSDPHPPKG